MIRHCLDANLPGDSINQLKLYLIFHWPYQNIIGLWPRASGQIRRHKSIN